ncbi:MAG TPA: hypothetical protein VG273_20020 [Bryobacteraceae bacterium]|nr:hypothetical protein [Bryobacteraceae bacterium]
MGVLSLVLLFGAGLSLFSDFHPAGPDGFLARFGFVRSDQLVAGMSYSDLVDSPPFLQRRLALDAANPYRWAELGEYFTAGDRIPEATRAYEHAVELGPNIPSILMRAANFYVLQDKEERVASLGHRILRLTPDFDQILFVDYARMDITNTDTTNGIPAEVRPARSWMRWLLANGKPQEILNGWTWLRNHRLADDSTAEALVRELWRRQMYGPAAEAWTVWAEPDRTDSLFNRRFQLSPRPVPCDWNFGNAAEFELHEGLHIHFTGAESDRIAALSQMTPVTPGPYRFTAVISAKDITTDQGPFFRIYDSEKPARLDVKTSAFLGTLPRQTIGLSLVIPAATRIVTVQLERMGSNRFDNKIQGDLQISEVSLMPAKHL